MKFPILLLSLVLAAQSLADWEPPIGIPTPAFGIDQVRPADPPEWPSAEASTPGAEFFYIEPNHPAATDTDNSYGYPDKPRLTIPGTGTDYLLKANAGRTMIVVGGTHPASRLVATAGSEATLGSPAMWFGYEGATITGTLELGYHNTNHDTLQYFLMDGFTVNARISIGGKFTSYVAVRNCNISKEGVGLVSVVPFADHTTSNIVIYDNWLHDTGSVNSGTDLDYHAVAIGTYGRNKPTLLSDVWVLDNSVQRVSGDATQVNAGVGDDQAATSNEMVDRIYIGRNTAHTNRQSGFWSKQGQNIIISQNRVWNMTRNGAQPGNSYGSQYGPDNLWFIFNEGYACNFGFRQSDTGVSGIGDTAYYVGNYIHDLVQQSGVEAWGLPEGWGMSFWSGNVDRFIVDNTFHNVYGGIFTNENYEANDTFSGNLISELLPNENPDLHGRPYEDHLHLDSAGLATEANAINFLVHDPVDARVQIDKTLYTSVAAVQAATVYGDTWLDETPALNGVFLTAAHSALPSNVESPVYQEFEDLYGRSIRFNFDGTPRPANTDPRMVGASQVFTGTKPDPVVTQQPMLTLSEHFDYGEIEIAVEGYGPLTYVWYKDGEILAEEEWKRVSFFNMDETDYGTYYAVVTDSFKSVQTNSIVVGDLPPTPGGPGTINIGTVNSGVFSIGP